MEPQAIGLALDERLGLRSMKRIRMIGWQTITLSGPRLNPEEDESAA
jgi:hypothetical protein